MPWAKKPPLPAAATQFEDFMQGHAGLKGGKPVHAPKAWRQVTTSLGWRLPHGMNRADHARRRMLRVIR